MAQNNQPSSGKFFQADNDWSSGYFACCEDVKDCLYVMFCFPCNACDFDKAIGNDEYCKCYLAIIPCACPNVSLPLDWIATRARIRAAYKIRGSTFLDIICSSHCGICQARRELKARGAIPE